MKARRGNKFGFTITEVIVSMSIFTLVIAGGLIGIRKGFEIVDNSRHYTRISQILQSEVESLRSLSWEDLQGLPSNTEIAIDTQFDTSVYDAYTVRREIISEETDLRRIEITVGYINRMGRAVNLKYLTFFTKGGVNDYFYRTI
jgi:prepilin-type N-terminal cleavage/methylation domain-containing protein